MYYLKSRLRIPPSLEVPRTGLEYLFMSKAFLRVYMSQQLRDMDPLDKAVLIPNLIVGNDHDAEEFAFNPIYLEPHETVRISLGVTSVPDKGVPQEWAPLKKMFTGITKNIYTTGTHYMSSLVVSMIRAYDGSHLVLTTVKPNKLYERYQKTQRGDDVRWRSKGIS